MESLWLLAVCFALGVLGRRWGKLPPDSHRALNAWVVNVALPALVLEVVHRVHVDARLLLAASALWVELGLAIAAALWAIRRGWMSAQVGGAWALAAGLGNTAFVGVPFLGGLGGAEAIGPAAVIDQLGSFGAFSALAVPFAAMVAGGRVRAKAVVLRVLRFPPSLALVAALVFRPWAFPPVLEGVLERLSATMSPLALATVGWQLDARALASHRRPMVAGLLYKLVLAPGLLLGVLWVSRPPFGLVERAAVAQAGMAPMVTAGVLALDSGLEGRLASAMIAVGVPLSLATVWLWWLASGALAS